MNSLRSRSSLMALVSVYLLYLAWQLFQGRNDPESSMAPALSILFTAVFAAAGAVLMVYAWKLWKRYRDGEEDREPPKDNENSLK